MRSHAVPGGLWVAGLVALVSAAIAFGPGLDKLVRVWFETEEYSHGVLIPFIAAFLVWQKHAELARMSFRGSWLGLALVLLGLALNVAGTLAALYTVQHYGLLITLYGTVLALTGWQVVRALAAPLLILLFMIPLPDFLLNTFSAQLQLISSWLGVWFIRLFGISVFLEGNIIDLGAYKLQVAEACSGLRYLFPLMTLGFLMAIFFRTAMWKRATLFLSSIPITLLMNSLRIGLIGVTVEHWGVEMAEGLLHDFEGWAIFMASAAVMLLEIVLLTRLGADQRSWREVFSVHAPARPAADASERASALRQPAPFFAASALLAITGAAVALLPERAEALPQRGSLAEFPARVGEWSGRRSAIERVYLDVLKLDDYVIADYARAGSLPVNFYVAWYDSQRAGRATHSPRSCIPGGGWRIRASDVVTLPGQSLRVNRVLIELGSQRQLVYYWFQQRGRVVTNEYLVKWFIFWDALTRNRTDGALVRLAAPIPAGVDDAHIDSALQDFARTVTPLLTRYVPG